MAIVCLLGPTASGKTAAALALAQRYPIEIISVDSALVYRDMDIGTAKPSAAELASVPHHLINLIDPIDAYSAAQFRADTLTLIAQIQARQRLPLLVGGTMLYYKALRDGLNNLPEANSDLRAELDAQAAAIGWPAMHAQLAQVDPLTAQRLAPHDSQRIQRALEVYRLTGHPMSQLLAAEQQPDHGYHFHLIALEPSDRSVLHTRIAHRFHTMLQQGLIDEVAQLKARGDLHLGLPSMRCVGYRQAWEYLDGQYDFATLQDKGIAATRQLAKRQLTWLRGMPERHVINCLDKQVIEQVTTQFDEANHAPRRT